MKALLLSAADGVPAAVPAALPAGRNVPSLVQQLLQLPVSPALQPAALPLTGSPQCLIPDGPMPALPQPALPGRRLLRALPDLPVLPFYLQPVFSGPGLQDDSAPVLQDGPGLLELPGAPAGNGPDSRAALLWDL